MNLVDHQTLLTQQDFSDRSLHKRLAHNSDKKRFPLIRSLLTLTAAGVVYSILVPKRNMDMLAPLKSIPQAKTVIELADSTFGKRIRTGDSYYALMAHHGISRDQAIASFRAFSKLAYNTLMEGDSLVLVKSIQGILRSVGVRTRDRTWYRVLFEGDSALARVETPNFVTDEVLITGVLENSLYTSVLDLGEKAELVVRFVDIFSWDINFFLDPREGDRFDMVVEKLYDEGDFVKYGRILAARYRTSDQEHNAFLFTHEDGSETYYDQDGRAVQKMFLKAPLHYSRISSGFSMRRYHPILHIYRAHPAVDYAAPTGTPVYAASDGVVVYAKWCGGYGKCVCIRHGKGYKTYHGHLSRYAKGIRTGKRVRQSECIGYVGTTGLATGPHLDYRVERNGRYINPLRIKSPRTKSLPAKYQAVFEEVKRLRIAQLDGDKGSKIQYAMAGFHGLQ